MTLIVVMAAYDPKAGVWFVESSDLPGLNVEAPTVEKLREKVPLAVADLIEAVPFTVPVEIDSRDTANKVLKDAGLPKAF